MFNVYSFILLVILLVLPIEVYSEKRSIKLTWEELEKGYFFEVRTIYNLDSKFLNGSHKEFEQKLLLAKISKESPIFRDFRKDDWKLSIARKTPRIMYKTNYINLSFSGKEEKIEYMFEIEPVCYPIAEIIRQEVSKHYKDNREKNINVSDLYNNLINNKLSEYLDTLPDVDSEGREKKCMEVYRLLKYIKNEEKYGFDTGSGELTKELKSFLDHVYQMLYKHIEAFEKNQAEMKVIGYTDARKIDNPYCLDEFSINEVSEECKGMSVEGIAEITNNCELSALRANNAINYLKKLGNDSGDIKFVSVAGGKKDAIVEDVPENRKISIDVRFNGGLKEQ